MRLSRPAVATGMVADGLGLATVLVADLRLNGPLITWQAADVVMAAILIAGAGTVALVLFARTRSLVFEASRSSLLAERARQRLGIYVSEEVAAKAMQTGILELGGARRELAVLFCDLRGFTRYSQQLPPEGLVAELNAYFEAMVAEIRREGGIIDKYIGDAVMAVFGLINGPHDAAAQALRAAVGMRRALERHNADRKAAGKPPLEHGIGIHFGPVVAGNIGTPERMQFTVIGEVVNMASRLESATKELGAPVLASAAVIEAASRSSAPAAASAAGGTPPAALRTEPKGSVTLRGHAQPVEVHAVLEAA